MTQDSPARPGMRRIVAASAVGNLLEWYDFAAYAYMAPVLGKLFFPASDPFDSLLASFGAFAAGYVVRPLGALIFGPLGDRLGRRALMIVSILMMGAATLAIGLLPTTTEIGVTAAILLVLLRIVQGLSLAGEYGGAITFIAEHAPERRRGFFTSIVATTQNAGFLLGSGIGAAVTALLGDAAMEGWGWRLPFLLGGVIALAALVLRRGLVEPPTIAEGGSRGTPLRSALRDHWREILQVGGLYVGARTAFYIVFVYGISFLTTKMHVSAAAAMDINTGCLLAMMLVPVPLAILSDRIGRRPVNLGSTIAMLLFAWPLFALMHHTDTQLVLLGQLGFAVVIGCMSGANAVTLVEVLPYHVRSTGLAIGINASTALFGGTAPMIATYLVQRTADDFSSVWYLMALTTVALIATLTIPETRGRRLT